MCVDIKEQNRRTRVHQKVRNNNEPNAKLKYSSSYKSPEEPPDSRCSEASHLHPPLKWWFLHRGSEASEAKSTFLYQRLLELLMQPTGRYLL